MSNYGISRSMAIIVDLACSTGSPSIVASVSKSFYWPISKNAFACSPAVGR